MAIEDAPLSKEATWMLSAEAASAKEYWTDVDTHDAFHAGYRHSVVGINWAAARAPPAKSIDDGESRSYLLAWIMSRQ